MMSNQDLDVISLMVVVDLMCLRRSLCRLDRAITVMLMLNL